MTVKELREALLYMHSDLEAVEVELNLETENDWVHFPLEGTSVETLTDGTRRFCLSGYLDNISVTYIKTDEADEPDEVRTFGGEKVEAA
jgi:hypothetical protein